MPAVTRLVRSQQLQAAIPTLLEARRARVLQRLVPACALMVALVCGAMLGAWLFGDANAELRSPFIYIMKFNTAFMLLLLAVALFGRWRDAPMLRTASLVCAGVALVLSVLTLSQYALHLNLGIDEALVRDHSATRFPGRTSPLTCGYVLIVATAFMLIGTRLGARLVPWLIFLAGGVPLVALGGYAYHAPDVSLTQGGPVVALQSTICQLLLCLGGLFLRADSDLMRLAVSESLAGSVARRLMPLAVGLPTLLGFLVVMGQRSRLFSGALGWALLVAGCALFFAAAVWLTTSLLLREEKTRAATDLRRLDAEAQVVDGRQRLQIALATAKLGTWELVIATGELESSAQCKANFGVAAEAELSYEAMLGSILSSDQAAVLAVIERALAQPVDYNAEYRIRWPDGSIHWIVASGRTLFDAGARPQRMVGVTLDVTERRQAEETLRRADRQKDEFLATLAHELRNPLAPIRQAAQIARSGTATPAQLNWGLDVIDRQAAHMALLLDDLLDISRITRGRLSLRKEVVELAAVVDTAVETARPVISAKHQHLHLELPQGPLRLNVDPLRFAQILANLLTNAAKYSDANGHIWLSARADGDSLILRMRDAGMGIEADVLPRIFTMFSQARIALDRSDGGLGIGLALVKGLVELHGGTIAADSPGLGGGSTFTVTLPQAMIREALAIAAAPDSSGAVATRRQRVLVADDNKDAADSLRMILELGGHEVRAANDGEEALAVALDFRPDVAFLDIGMPKMNGFEVARRIRGAAGAGEMRLVALTGWGQPEDRARSAAAGFDHHLTKPIDFDEMAAIMARPPRSGTSSGDPVSPYTAST